MMGLFKMAGEELKLDEKKKEVVSEKIDPLLKKIDVLLEQNQKIAKGIVAVADLVKEASGETPVKKPIPRIIPKQKPVLPPIHHPMGAVPPPPMPHLSRGPPNIPPPPGLGEMPSLPREEAGLPPFEFEEEKPKKKGLFGLFGKK